MEVEDVCLPIKGIAHPSCLDALGPLHAIYGMLRHGQDFDGEKFYATPQTAPATP
jgi:hypothetical protein